jgi:two-component system phosphate regulon sensor histidine kinase PhoR
LTTTDARSPVIAVRVDSLADAVAAARPAGPTLAVLSDAGGEPLDRRLDGLALIWPPSEGASDTLSERTATFYATALAIVLGVGLFGAYLLWRDVQRDIRLTQLRSQFVASVSHELKTPLTSIRLFAETLRDRAGIDPVTRAEYLDTIARDSDRLTRLLDNVLDFSRIERGERTYSMAEQDLATVVERALRTVRYPLERRRFILNFAADRHLPPVACDADAVEQAVLNLVSNAAKYAGDSRRIDVRLTGARNEVMLAVRDYGTGIAEQYHSRLFDRFYRAPTADNDTIQGTGLGLTLVAHFAEGHGGRLSIQSAPGKGSTFTLHLPCTPKEMFTMQSPAPSAVS